MAADWEAYNLFSSIDKVVGTQRQVQLGWLCVVTDDFQKKPSVPQRKKWGQNLADQLGALITSL